MIRLTTPIVAILFSLWGGVVAAQDPPPSGPIPDVTAEVWPYLIGDRIVSRVIITNSINARSYEVGDRVRGGNLRLHYSVTCEGANCPSPTLQTGKTVISCGQQEGIVKSVNIGHLKGKGPLTIKLIINSIEFEAFENSVIDRVNDQYPAWPNGMLACPIGTYEPDLTTSGSNWTSAAVTVN